MDFGPLNDATGVVVNLLTTAGVVLPVAAVARRKMRAELHEHERRMKHAIDNRPPVQNSGEGGVG